MTVRMRTIDQAGFTLIELLVSIAIVGILSSIVLANLNTARNKARLSDAEAQMRSIATAVTLYQNDHGGQMPADENRALPAALRPYLADGWPVAPWPGSVYDWDNWTDPDDASKHIWQVSLRFCPADAAAVDCPAPDFDWAAGFDGHSALYYCIEGACRPYQSDPVTHPGYCVNCNN